jgi:hypothetical protein
MTTIARYTVKARWEERNAELVRAVYRALAELRPEGFSYATYRLDDGRTSLHIAEQRGEGEGPLPGLAAFRGRFERFERFRTVAAACADSRSRSTSSLGLLAHCGTLGRSTD